MKSLVTKLLLPLAFVGTLLFSEPVLANDNESSNNFYLSSGAGLFTGFERPFKDTCIPRIRLGVGLENNSDNGYQGASLRYEANISYATKETQSPSAHSSFGERINIIDINSRFLGVFKTGVINPYLGIEFSFSHVNEKLESDFPAGFKFGGVLGLDIPVGENFSLFAEATENSPFLKNNYEGAHIEGLSLDAGIRFFF